MNLNDITDEQFEKLRKQMREAPISSGMQKILQQVADMHNNRKLHTIPRKKYNIDEPMPK